MKYHKYDPKTFVYIETVESSVHPDNSTDKQLPELTDFYTVAFFENQWVSVIRPEYEVIDNQIVKKALKNTDGTES